MNFKTKILVIESDQLLVKTIRNILTQRGYDVCCANSGTLGIQKAFEYHPDLILCAIDVGLIDGYNVYNSLKDSCLIDTIPFIFITSKSELQDIRFGMDLGADDYLVKPFDNETLIHSVGKRLTKFKKLVESGKSEFKAISYSSPNGSFLFDGHILSEANPALIQMLDLKKNNITSYSIEDLLDPLSYQKIKEKINRCASGLLNSFCETVFLIPTGGEKFEVTLHISLCVRNSHYILMAGLVSLHNIKSDENPVFLTDILKVLKGEKIVVTEILHQKLADIFKQNSIKMKTRKNELFSHRENQVLCLSTEGLSTKLIANELFISDRTVEKHRAKLMEKTNSKNMIEVITFAIRNNLVDFKTIPFLTAFFVNLFDFEIVSSLGTFFFR